MSQEFFKQHEEARKLIRIINEDISNVESLSRQGQSTTKTNQVISQQLSKLSNIINSQLNAVNNIEGQKTEVLTKLEQERRRKMVFELQSSHDSLSKKSRNNRSHANGTQLFASSNKSSYKDSIDTNTVSMEKLRADKQTFDVEYDRKISQISDATTELKIGQDMMGNELGYQNELLLPDIESQIDRNNIKLIRNNSKLNRLLQRGSDFKLWLCLILELAVLILLIVKV